MKAISIENTELANLTNCDSEPIHTPGTIQPHGFLLALDTDYKVKFCSKNISDFQLSLEHTLDQNILSVFDPEQSIIIKKYLDNSIFESTKPLTCQHQEIYFNVNVHRSGEYFILEFEPFPDGNLELSNLYLQTKKFTSILSETIGLKQLCQTISEEVKFITGYDRVMVYTFDEKFNGEIFAEAKNAELEPFLGLHYPHTDIPAQARALYQHNLMRMIVDVNYIPAPLLTFNKEADHEQLDLSHSLLRSVSPIHIEYLKNMGVSGTLTISLMSDNKLWGLIACHHYSAKNLPHYVRISARLQGHFLTSQIKVQKVAEEYALKMKLDKKLDAFLAILDSHSLKAENDITVEELVSLTNSHGVCLVSDASVYSYGDVPEIEEITTLLKIMSEKNFQFVSSANVLNDFGLYLSSQVAGCLYYKLDETVSLLWFRNEFKKEIHWAGDPDKSIMKDQSGLSPRKSFAVWKEVVTNYSSDWQQAEIDIANKCVYAIQKHYSILKSKKVQKTQSKLLKKLQQANEELENINWISTHDLKEPLRKIRVFASMLLNQEKFTFDPQAANLIGRMAASAGKMHNLLDDLMSFAKVKNGEYVYEEINLNELLNFILEENKDVIQESKCTVNIDSLPIVHGITVLMRQLLSNLLFNSIKFSRPDISPVITIRSRLLPLKEEIAFYELVISDNGQGFENQYADLIFKAFQRLQYTSQIEGTGVGLAICKKIVEMHKGKIVGEGLLNQGATFTITLPFHPDHV